MCTPSETLGKILSQRRYCRSWGVLVLSARLHHGEPEEKCDMKNAEA